MALTDYIILAPTEHTSDPNTANGFLMTTILEPARQIKTPEIYDANGFVTTSHVMETDQECLERIAGPNREIFLKSDLTFKVLDINREATEYPTGPSNTIDANYNIVSRLKEDKIRSLRNEQLRKLDVPFMRAVETGDSTKQAAIGQKKQALRDLPPLFTANLTSNSTLNVANTITRQIRIKDYTPDELGDDFIVEFTS